MKCISPSKAINRDVLPEPVGPTTRLIQPHLKNNSSSMRRKNCRLDGVNDPLLVLDHEKTALRKPISLGSTSAPSAMTPTVSSLAFSMKESNSSVWENDHRHVPQQKVKVRHTLMRKSLTRSKETLPEEHSRYLSFRPCYQHQ
jgi:hypothetical protein